MEINIGIAAKNRKSVGKLLNLLLADEFVVYTKTLKYHWNVYGIVFHDFHLMFKEQYEALLDICDDVAERARALDEPAEATMQEFLKNTRLKEEPGKIPDAPGMIKILLDNHEAIIREIRKGIDETEKLGDMGTNNFLTELMEKHEKFAWMLRATIQK